MLWAVAVLALAGAAAPPPVHHGVHHIVRESRGTRADVAFVDGRFGNDARPRIRIVRDGRLLATERIPPHPRGRAYGVVPLRLAVRDLDGDGEPEVLVDLFWGGAYCCAWSRVYRFAGHGYVESVHWWGDLDAEPRLRDLDGDGRPELVSVDDRFAALTAHVASFFPLRVWSYGHGRFRDVTRRHPAEVSGHAAWLWRFYVGHRGPPRYVLAAWAADECLLGRSRAAERVLARAQRRGELDEHLGGPAPAAAYLVWLKRFLHRTGYR